MRWASITATMQLSGAASATVLTIKILRSRSPAKIVQRWIVAQGRMRPSRRLRRHSTVSCPSLNLAKLSHEPKRIARPYPMKMRASEALGMTRMPSGPGQTSCASMAATLAGTCSSVKARSAPSHGSKEHYSPLEHGPCQPWPRQEAERGSLRRLDGGVPAKRTVKRTAPFSCSCTSKLAITCPDGRPTAGEIAPHRRPAVANFIRLCPPCLRACRSSGKPFPGAFPDPPRPSPSALIAGAVDQQVQQSLGAAIRDLDGVGLLATRQSAEIRHAPVEAHQARQAPDEARRLPRRLCRSDRWRADLDHAERHLHRQAGPKGGITVGPLAATLACRRGTPATRLSYRDEALTIRVQQCPFQRYGAVSPLRRSW